MLLYFCSLSDIFIINFQKKFQIKMISKQAHKTIGRYFASFQKFDYEDALNFKSLLNED